MATATKNKPTHQPPECADLEKQALESSLRSYGAAAELAERLDRIAERVDTVAKRLVLVDQVIKNLPSPSELRAIAASLDELNKFKSLFRTDAV